MATLPLATAFTDSAVTEGDFKTAITDQRTFLADLLGTDGTKDTALRTLGAFGNDVSAKSSNYTVVATDRGVVFNCTSTFTLSLTAAATLGDGFTFAVINSGSGTITIDPNSTEQIDGANTKTIAAGSWAIVSCTGSAFITMGSVPSIYTGKNIAVFGSSGSWTVPDGVTSAIITAIGGGGGARNINNLNPGAGGDGGIAIAYCTGLSGSLSITIGAGGNGNSGGNGASGGTTSVTGTGVSISATGGGGGSTSTTGSNGVGSVSTGTALRTGGLQLSAIIGLAIGHYITSGNTLSTSQTAQAWSATSGKSAGSGAPTTTPISGGIGGAVVIEW